MATQARIEKYPKANPERLRLPNFPASYLYAYGKESLLLFLAKNFELPYAGDSVERGPSGRRGVVCPM